MSLDFDRGMDDAYTGKEINGDPGLEYLRGYGYIERLYETHPQVSEQCDDRDQPDDRVQQPKED